MGPELSGPPPVPTRPSPTLSLRAASSPLPYLEDGFPGGSFVVSPLFGFTTEALCSSGLNTWGAVTLGLPAVSRICSSPLSSRCPSRDVPVHRTTLRFPFLSHKVHMCVWVLNKNFWWYGNEQNGGGSFPHPKSLWSSLSLQR